MLENARKVDVSLVLINRRPVKICKSILCPWSFASDTKKDFFCYVLIHEKSKFTHVLNSRYIRVQHSTICYLPAKESRYPRPYKFKELTCPRLNIIYQIISRSTS